MSKPNTPPVRLDKLAFSTEKLRAFVHPLRLEMISLISRHDGIFVKDIHTFLNLEQSLVSQHLRILRQTKLVEAKRKGKFIYYSVNYPIVEGLVSSVYDFLDRNDLPLLEEELYADDQD